jgi:hypothetical protein
MNGFTGPILASITALTRLVALYAPPPPCGLPADSGLRMARWRRRLRDNRFSGSAPPTISALTSLAKLYASIHRPGSRRCGACLAARPPDTLSAVCPVRPHAALCLIRDLAKNGFTGPILASITALTKLFFLYALPPPCGPPADSGLRMGTLWRRYLNENRFSGSVPSTISALTALKDLCAPTAALHRGLDECCSKLPQESLGCRELFGNRLEGRVPPSLLAMRIPAL